MPNKVVKKVNNNWQKFTATELKDVVVNVNKLKTDTAKYSSEGLAKNVPLVKDVITMSQLLKHIGSNIKVNSKSKKIWVKNLIL